MDHSSSSSNAADFAWMLPPVILMLPSLVLLMLPSFVTLVAPWVPTDTSVVSMRIIVYSSTDMSTLRDSLLYAYEFGSFVLFESWF